MEKARWAWIICLDFFSVSLFGFQRHPSPTLLYKSFILYDFAFHLNILAQSAAGTS